ncbi:MAG: hypothetical protein RQ732_11190 [Methylophaga sp.]|nr:hypothetical protein [Methylophaga sp.]
MRVWILCWVLALSANVYAEDAAELIKGETATISLDRSWGLLIGDEITAEITLPADLDIDTASLPQRNKRHGAWLYLRDNELSGNRLLMHYQVTNVPAETREVATPVFELRTTEGGFINIPEAPLQIGSFLAAENADADGRFVPRGDQVLLPAGNVGLQQQLWISLLILIISVLIWLAWHFGFRPRHRLPFAHAVFELNKMRWLGRKNVDMASRKLHHAFNRSAGTVLVASKLDKLWQQSPWLLPMQPEIDSFYQQSATHFFSAQGGGARDFSQLLDLARACRVREKMA